MYTSVRACLSISFYTRGEGNGGRGRRRVSSNPSWYPPTGTMFEVTRKVKYYVGLAFRICGTINLWRTDGRAGGQGQTSQTKCSRLVFQKQTQMLALL